MYVVFIIIFMIISSQLLRNLYKLNYFTFTNMTDPLASRYNILW